MPSLEKRPVKNPHRELPISHFSASSFMIGILYYCAGLFCHPFPRPVHLYFHFDHVTFPSVIWLEPQHQCLGAANATRVTKQQRRPGGPLSIISIFQMRGQGDRRHKTSCFQSRALFTSPCLEAGSDVGCVAKEVRRAR